MTDIDEYYQLIEKYNLKVDYDSDKNIMIYCPFHNDEKASFSINKRNGLFKCFSTVCEVGGGNVEKFKRLLEENF